MFKISLWTFSGREISRWSRLAKRALWLFIMCIGDNVGNARSGVNLQTGIMSQPRTPTATNLRDTTCHSGDNCGIKRFYFCCTTTMQLLRRLQEAQLTKCITHLTFVQTMQTKHICYTTTECLFERCTVRKRKLSSFTLFPIGSSSVLLLS